MPFVFSGYSDEFINRPVLHVFSAEAYIVLVMFKEEVRYVILSLIYNIQ